MKTNTLFTELLEHYKHEIIDSWGYDNVDNYDGAWYGDWDGSYTESGDSEGEHHSYPILNEHGQLEIMSEVELETLATEKALEDPEWIAYQLEMTNRS